MGSYSKVRWELLERLQPDLLLTTTSGQNPLTRELRRRGGSLFPIPLPHSVWRVLEKTVPIGDLLGVDAMPLVDDPAWCIGWLRLEAAAAAP